MTHLRRWWIDHPLTQAEPVSLLRKLAYELGLWMQEKGRKMECWVLNGPDDDIPF